MQWYNEEVSPMYNFFMHELVYVIVLPNSEARTVAQLKLNFSWFILRFVTLMENLEALNSCVRKIAGESWTGDLAVPYFAFLCKKF